MKKAMVLICVFMMISVHSYARKKSVVKAVGGMTIAGYNIAIDASYDSQLDALVPGYKILNVAIMNNSFDIIVMDPKEDKWWIKTKNTGKKYRVIGDLRDADTEAWNKIPDRAKNLVAYPLVLPIGARQVIDIFVPDNIPVEEFRELAVYIDSLNTTFEIVARQ